MFASQINTASAVFRETLNFEPSTHMPIYLDHAASTPLDPEVFEYMHSYFLDFTGNPSSTHAYGREQRSAIEDARRRLASLLNCKPYEIYFTSGGTEADNTVIQGSVALGIKHIITTRIEHHAVTHPVEHLEHEEKITATWLSVDRKGHIDLAELENALKAHPGSLVCLMHGNNEIGTLYDLHAIGELCHAYNARFHSDTVQTIGQIRLNLAEIPVDFITASAHKFNGPKGTGFLYVRKGVQLPALISGGGQERELRAGTENLPGIMGLTFALEKTYQNIETKQQTALGFKNYLRDQLAQTFPEVEFNGDPEHSLPNILNVSFPVEEDLMLLFNLDLGGIAASAGSACNSGALQGSHVLQQIGASDGAIRNTVRFSFGMGTTQSDLDEAVSQLKSILTQHAS